MQAKQQKRYRRHQRIRAKVFGTSKIPRLVCFRSARHIYVQLVDDDKGKTLAAVSDRELKGKKGDRRTSKAKEIGKLIAKEALEKKIEKVIFDRGGYKFHGIVKAVAEGAREGGLKF